MILEDPHSEDLRTRALSRLGVVLREKYRLDDLIGVGGMAAVYAATHRNGRLVAIKVLHAHLNAVSGMHSRFIQEGYLANKVGHPGVVEIIDDDRTEESEPFLVMEWLQGNTIDAIQKAHGGRIPLEESLRIAVRLLEILASAHSKAILHRDIKPANVMVCTDGTVKLLDFGVAKQLDPQGPIATQAGMPVGTPSFMAPEQALGRPENIDLRSDIFGVGALLFCCLSGRNIHEAHSTSEALVLAATEAAPSTRSVAPEIPNAVAMVVDRALAFDKESRWPSAEVMGQALTKASQAGQAEAQAPEPLHEDAPVNRKTGLPTKYRIYIVILGLLLLTIGGATALARRQLAPGPRAPTAIAAASEFVNQAISRTTKGAAVDSAGASPTPPAASVNAPSATQAKPKRTKPNSSATSTIPTKRGCTKPSDCVD